MYIRVVFTFEGAAFNKPVDFSDAIFAGYTSFKGAMFEWPFFSEAGFFGENFFNGCIINGDANFEGVTFDGNTDFRGITFRKGAEFNETTVRGSFLGWADLKKAIISNEVTYLGLIKNFKDYGQFDDADDCYYTYRSRNMKNSFSDTLAQYSCGFGVRWLQTIYFGIFWLVSFGLLYFLMITTQRGFKKEMIVKQLLNSFWFSAMVLLSVPSELYPRRNPIYKEYASKIKYHLPILERLIGWGILILFINTLSRTMLHS